MPKLLTLLFLAIQTAAFCQNVTIEGVALDPDKAPVEFLNVFVLQDTNIISGALTDKEGNFKFEIPHGNYTLKTSHLYFEDITKNLDVTTQSKRIELTLVEKSIELDQITVTEFKNVTEAGIDKRVIHVSDELKKMNTNLSEILEMVSLVNMDMEGNPSIPGKQGVTVLVDGRPPRVRANDLATVLRLIPTDQIVRIEIMTNPPAKYTKSNDAVINVITNRKPQKGKLFNGWGRINDFGALGLGGNFTWKNDRWGASIWGGRWGWKSRNENTEERINFNAIENYSIKAENKSSYNGNGFYFGMAPEYQWNEKNIISFNTGLFAWNNNNTSTGETIIFNNNQQLSQEILRKSKGNFRGIGGYIGMEYFKYFDEKEKELTISLEFSPDWDNDDSEDKLLSSPNFYQKFDGEDQSSSIDFETEFFDPIDSSSSLNYAVEISHTLPYDDYLNYYSGNSEDQLVKDEDLSYHNTIEETNMESSISYSKKFEQFGINLDLGQQWINYDFLFDQKHKVDRSFLFLVPKVSVNFQPLDGLEMGLSYKYSSEAPYRHAMNPNVRLSADRLSIWSGNPDLDPENSHNLEFNSGFYVGKFNIGTTAFWRYSNNAISQFAKVDEKGVKENTYANLGEYTRTGLDFTVSGNIKKWLKMDFNTSVFDSRINQTNGLSQKTIGYNGKIQASTFLPKQWSIRMSARYTGPELAIQGQREGNYIIRASIKKGFLKGKLNATLSFDDIFRTSIRDSEWVDPAFSIKNRNQRFRPYVGIRLNYRIGELKEMPKSSKAGKQQ